MNSPQHCWYNNPPAGSVIQWPSQATGPTTYFHRLTLTLDDPLISISHFLSSISIFLVGGWAAPLKNISQLGWLFPIYGKIKNVPNHQPVLLTCEKSLHAWWLNLLCSTMRVKNLIKPPSFWSLNRWNSPFSNHLSPWNSVMFQTFKGQPPLFDWLKLYHPPHFGCVDHRSPLGIRFHPASFLSRFHPLTLQRQGVCLFGQALRLQRVDKNDLWMGIMIIK